MGGWHTEIITSSIVLVSGLKFKCTSSDSLGDILMPRYFMVSEVGGIGGGRAAAFHLYIEIGSIVHLDQLIEQFENLEYFLKMFIVFSCEVCGFCR